MTAAATTTTATRDIDRITFFDVLLGDIALPNWAPCPVIRAKFGDEYMAMAICVCLAMTIVTSQELFIKMTTRMLFSSAICQLLKMANSQFGKISGSTPLKFLDNHVQLFNEFYQSVFVNTASKMWRFVESDKRPDFIVASPSTIENDVKNYDRLKTYLLEGKWGGVV